MKKVWLSNLELFRPWLPTKSNHKFIQPKPKNRYGKSQGKVFGDQLGWGLKKAIGDPFVSEKVERLYRWNTSWVEVRKQVEIADPKEIKWWEAPPLQQEYSLGS